MNRVIGRWFILEALICFVAASTSLAAEHGTIPNLATSQGQYKCVDHDGAFILSDSPCEEIRASNYKSSDETSHRNYFSDRSERPGAYQRAVSALNDLSGASVNERLNIYFSAGNSVNANDQCHLYIHTENVPPRKLIDVKRRDRYRCLVCSSREQLKIDHIQAIANGGDNSADNLALLCASCYNLKTELDRTLRWEREERCR